MRNRKDVQSLFSSITGSSQRTLFLFAACMILGVLAGSMASSYLHLFENEAVLSLFFSGIPVPENGFFFCFTTFLFNMLISFLVLFLLGVTAFGAVAVPFFLFVKGITVGISSFSFLNADGLSGLFRSALLYMPVMAAASLLTLFFAVRAMYFSRRLAKLGFSSCEGNLDFSLYFKTFLQFLCLAIVAAFLGAVPSALYQAFFS